MRNLGIWVEVFGLHRSANPDKVGLAYNLAYKLGSHTTSSTSMSCVALNRRLTFYDKFKMYLYKMSS